MVVVELTLPALIWLCSIEENMALLDFGTPQYLTGLLGEDELNRLKGQAQSDAMLNMATALLQAGAPSRVPGSGALAIAQGLQQGQQAYKNALQQGLQEKVMAMQVGEMARKQQEAQRMREMFPQIFNVSETPAVSQQAWSGSPSEIGQYFQTGQIPTITTPGQRSISVDTNKLQALAAMSSNPLETYASLAKLVPDLRKAGFIGGATQGENPFAIFSTDETLPKSIRNVAKQYESSYEKGMIDPEKVDERIRQLGDAAQRAATQAGNEQLRRDQMAQSLMIAQGQQAITGMMAQERIEAAREKKEAAATTKADAKSQLTDIVSNLKKNYETLREEGGIVSEQDTGLANIGARISSSGLGQLAGGAIGTRTQAERQKIEQTRPLLLNLIKNATGMSAQQMNSNAEMQLYLNAATNPQLSYEANMEALKNLDRLYGLGNVAKDIESEMKKPKKSSGPSRSGW